MTISRRDLLAGALGSAPALWAWPLAADDGTKRLRQAVASLERQHGGRLGVAILDTSGTKPFAYRGDERFPMCSTHKVLSAAFVLARVDRKEESLARRMVYGKGDLVPYSPITEKHVGTGGLTVGEICEAAITVSDNTAANLMLDGFGGPKALTTYLRSLGDGVTRLDRREPELNEATPGDSRDTTTPLAMLQTMRKIVLGNALSASSRERLATWMAGCKTGEKRLRAGLPMGWQAGDKTGSGRHNATNDVALFWPPRSAPIVVTAYYVGAHASDDERNAVLAAVGRLAATIRAQR